MSSASATVTDEQFAARELVRSWAAASDAIAAARDVEQGDPDAWRAAVRRPGPTGHLRRRASRGTRRRRRHRRGPLRDGRRGRRRHGARSGRHHGAGHAGDRRVARRLARSAGSGERTAGVALCCRPALRRRAGRRAPPSSCSAPTPAGVLLLPAGDELRSRRRHRRRRDRRTAEGHRLLPAAGPRRAGLGARRRCCPCRSSASRTSPRRCWPPRPPGWRAGRCRPPPSTRRCASSSASRSAASRPSSTCAPRCCCAPSRSRWPRLTPRSAVDDSDDRQLSIAAAVAAADRHRGREGQRQGLHPGARRHRHHLGARRASLPAPRLRHRAVPRRRVALAAPRRGADAARACAANCTSTWTRVEHLQPEIAAAVAEVAALPDEKRQVALAESGAAWRRTGRSRTAAPPAPPSSC